MNDDIDAFIQQFQEEMIKEARKTYGEVFFKRWQNPLYMGPMEDPDAFARLKGTCGDTMMIFLKFENGHVKAASFQTDGCAPSIVCGSYAAGISIGKNPEELLDITGDTIINKLGKLPEEVHHCAFLAATTVHDAVDEYMIKRINKKNKSSA